MKKNKEILNSLPISVRNWTVLEVWDLNKVMMIIIIQ